MAKQTIGIGAVANDGNGDPLRTAFDKANDNFDELYQIGEDWNPQTGFAGQATATWSGTGLVFDVRYPAYYIGGIRYAAGSSQITLNAADGTNPRKDIIAVDATGAIKITGTPAAAPVNPTVDVLTQIPITSILVNALAVVPSAITNEDVYKENVEWTGSSDNGSVDFNAVAVPFAGTKHVDCGSFSAGQYIKFVSTNKEFSDYSFVRFYINLKAVFASTAGFIVKFYDGTTLVSSSVTVTNGKYGFSGSTINSYQLITIPVKDFEISAGEFDTLYFETKGTNATGFRLDNIVLQSGLVGASSKQYSFSKIIAGNTVASADQDLDSLVFTAGSGLSISAAGKTITFGLTGGSGHVIQNAGTPLTNRANLNVTNGLVASDDAGNDATIIGVANNGITNARLRQSAAWSVIGNSTNATANVADISASANDQIFRRTSDALSFGSLTVGMAPANLWSYAKIQQVVASRLLGNATGSVANIAEIPIGFGLTFSGGSLLVDNTAVVTTGGSYANPSWITSLAWSKITGVTGLDTFEVASEAAMLALSAAKGDIAVRTDTSESYRLTDTDPTVLANWQLLRSTGSGIGDGVYGDITVSSGGAVWGVNVNISKAWTGAQSFIDSNFSLLDNSDGTKIAKFELSSISTATTRTYTLPDGDGLVVVGALAQTLTNKTLAAGTVFSVIPTINDGITFTFNPNGTVSGLNVGSHTADPSTPVNGDVYYDSINHLLRARINSAWVSLGAGGGSGHIIENAGTPLTARANLNFRNGLNAADNTPDTDAKLGGPLIENTTITGTGFSFGLDADTIVIASVSGDTGVLEADGAGIHFRGAGGADITADVTGLIFTAALDTEEIIVNEIRSAGNQRGAIYSNSSIGSDFTNATLIHRAYGDARYAQLGAANVFGDFDNTFRSNRLRVANPANTFFYSFTGAAIVADRVITLPLLSGNDTMVMEGFVQTLTGKTLGASTKILLGSDATGDIYYNGGSGALTRLAAGTLGYVLTSNGAGVAPSWQAASGGTPWELSGGGTFSAPIVLTGSGTNTLKFVFDSLAVTPVNGAGAWFANTTAAAAGAQQISPSLVLEGQGWKTNATAASQQVLVMQDVLPIQGAANPTASWRLRASVNGGAYATMIETRNDGTVIGYLTNGSSQSFNIQNGTLTLSSGRMVLFNGGSGIIATDSGATIGMRINTTATVQSTGYVRIYNIQPAYTNTTGDNVVMGLEAPFAPTSGTGTLSALKIISTVNQTGGASGLVTYVKVNPTYTAAVSVIGYDYVPVSGTATTEIAYRATQGNLVFGGTAIGSTGILGWNNTTKELKVNGFRIWTDSDTNGKDNFLIMSDASALPTPTGIDNITILGLQAIAGGSGNLALGNTAGSSITSGDYNIILGFLSGTSIVSGSGNVIIGGQSGDLITGSHNITLGYFVGKALTTSSASVLIGYDIEAQSNTASNQLSIQNAIFGLANAAINTTISDGIIGIYSIAAQGSWQRALFIGNSSAQDTVGIADGTVLYSKDVSASSELFVMDEAGNETQLSPHYFGDIPGGASEDMAWSYYSNNYHHKKSINVDMLAVVRAVEDLYEKMTGEKKNLAFIKNL